MSNSMRSLQSLVRRCGGESSSSANIFRCTINYHHSPIQRNVSQSLHHQNNIRRKSYMTRRILSYLSNNNNLHHAIRYTSTSAIQLTLSDDLHNDTIPPPTTDTGDMTNIYAVAVITPNSDGKNTKISTKKLSIQQIVEEIPGTHARDFFSLALTSLGDASRKRHAMMTHSHYSVKNNIHPWFILPRKTEIVMAFGCVRAIINTKSALIFDAHKPTIKQHAMRISNQLMRKDTFAFRDGKIILHKGEKAGKSTTPFEVDMVEQIVREVCTMYSRRIRLYEPIVNSLMDRVTSEAFSHSNMHKLVPVKDSLQRFEMNVKGALHSITDLLENDEDMIDLQLTEKARAKAENRTLPHSSHESVEMLLEEYARQLNSILLEIDYMLSRVQSKQDMMALSLDGYRNRMIRMNLYLTIGGISLAFGTAVAGFFGMNVVNGYEEAEGIFELVVLGSCLFGGGFLGGCYSYLNGGRSHQRTLDSLSEIEVMNRALGDMSALDYSFDLMLSEKEPLTRDKFREKIYAGQPESIRDKEVDFLFDLLDYSDDGVIDKDDFNVAKLSS